MAKNTKADDMLGALSDKPAWLEEESFYRSRITLEGTDEYVTVLLVDCGLAEEAIKAMTRIGASVHSTLELFAQSDGGDTANESVADATIDQAWELVDRVLYRCVPVWTVKDHAGDGSVLPIPASLADAKARHELYRRLPVRLVGRIILAVVYQAKNL